MKENMDVNLSHPMRHFAILMSRRMMGGVTKKKVQHNKGEAYISSKKNMYACLSHLQIHICTCIYVYIYIYIYIYIWIYTYIYLCIYICVYANFRISIYIYIYVIQTYLYRYMYMHIHRYMCVGTYVSDTYVSTHICICI